MPESVTLPPVCHRKIPKLPARPRVHPIASHINRSYSGGRENFQRACQGHTFTVTISSDESLPDTVQANLISTLDSQKGNVWNALPFERIDDRTLVCRTTPRYPGLHSFRTEFSRDNGLTWQRDTVPDAWVLIDPPQVDGLRLYSLIPTVSGTLADWASDLERIRDLGFNAVHLLPITALDTSESPYSAYDLFDIDRSYLVPGSHSDSLTQLEQFVERARELGIRLCFDLVLNHIGVDSKMASRAPDWIVPDQVPPDGFRRARYWAGQGWHIWEDLILIDYEHPSEAIRAEIWRYMTEYALFWAGLADSTGGFVRFDNLHGSDPNFIAALCQTLYAEYPNVACIAEYFTDESTLLRHASEWGLNLCLATPWDSKFVPDLREYLKYIHRISRHIRYFMPITSHDAGAPAEEFGSADATIPRYVAAALLGTGATGMPQGVEFGEAHKIPFIGRQPKRTLSVNPPFAEHIRRVNEILASNTAFQRGANCFFVDDSHHAVIAAFRSEDSEETAGFLIACNFDIGSEQRITVDLAPFLGGPGPYPCRELLAEEERRYAGPSFEIILGPNSAQVLKFARTPAPGGD